MWLHITLARQRCYITVEMLASLYCFTVQQLANIFTLDSVIKVLQWNYCLYKVIKYIFKTLYWGYLFKQFSQRHHKLTDVTLATSWIQLMEAAINQQLLARSVKHITSCFISNWEDDRQWKYGRTCQAKTWCMITF